MELSEASSLIVQIGKLRPRGKRWLVQGYTVSQRLEASRSSCSLQGFRDIKKQAACQGLRRSSRQNPNSMLCSYLLLEGGSRWAAHKTWTGLSRGWPGILGWEMLVFHFVVFYTPLYFILFSIKQANKKICLLHLQTT